MSSSSRVSDSTCSDSTSMSSSGSSVSSTRQYTVTGAGTTIVTPVPLHIKPPECGVQCRCQCFKGNLCHFFTEDYNEGGQNSKDNNGVAFVETPSTLQSIMVTAYTKTDN